MLNIILGFNRWCDYRFSQHVICLKTITKNPPINEKMIRAMYMEMGRKPSEAQIKNHVICYVTI